MVAARRTALAAYFALLLLLIAWEVWWAEPTPLPRTFWVALKISPLIIPLVWLWRGSARAYVLSSLLLLIYFCEGVTAVYGACVAGNAAGLLYGIAETLLAIVAIVAASVYARFVFRSPASQTRARTES